MSDTSRIVTLDIVEAQTSRAKCYHCEVKIARGSLKGVITLMVDVQNRTTGEIKPVQQNRSLCDGCVRTNIEALYNHLQMLAKKIGM